MDTLSLVEHLTTGDKLTQQGRAFCEWLDRRKDSDKTSTYKLQVQGKSESDKAAYIQQYPNSLALLWDMFKGSPQMTEDAKPTASGQPVTVSLAEADINAKAELQKQQYLDGVRAQLALLSNGQTLTPAGEKLAAWLEQYGEKLAQILPPQQAGASPDRSLEAAPHYLAMVRSGTFEPARYFYAFPEETLALWGAYQYAVQSGYQAAETPAAQPTESVKRSPDARHLLRLQEAENARNQLRTATQRFIDFLTPQILDLIAHHPTAKKEVREAARHWRELVGREGLPPAYYMRDYPTQTSWLKEVFTAYETEEGNTPPRKPLPKLVSSSGQLTYLGETITHMLQGAARADGLAVTPATRAWIALVEANGIPPARFFAENPREADHLYVYCLNHLQTEIQALGDEIRAKAGGA